MNNLALAQKLHILVCFDHIHIGGATTSLVNFLNALNPERYDVDVMFYENAPENRAGIRESVRILPQGKANPSGTLANVLKKACNPLYLTALIRDRYYKKIRHNKEKAVQIMSKQGYKYSRRVHGLYDVAIAYDVGWCMNYVVNQVHAKKKILWQHMDLEKSGMDFRVDKRCYDRMDALVFVSRECMKKYSLRHPEHAAKCYFVPNLLSTAYVRGRGEEGNAPLPFPNAGAYCKLVTAARIKFDSKGFDRAVEVFARLKKDGRLDRVKWVIVGGGKELPTLLRMVAEAGLEEIIYPIGARENPMPYLKQCDLFFLPSRHEGKPMSVTEAMMLGLPPVVTEYASAREQIQDGVDGLIFPNSEEGLYQGLRQLFAEPEQIAALREKVLKTDYGNEEEIAVFDQLVKELTESV